MLKPMSLGQQTAATLLLFSKRVRAARPTGSRRRKPKPPAKRTVRSSKRASSKRPGRLVKGSAAAKRYMASIRKKKR